jgi:[NiFe] hydrogenase diaphorase moiety small subunit
MTGPAPRRFRLDGVPVPFEPGDTIIEAATRAGHWVPHLCWHPDFAPHGSCRLCTVRVDGRTVAACSAYAADGQVVESRTPALDAYRRQLLQCLFVEGNHFCPGCEASGDCLLQATAYAMGMDTPHFESVHRHRPIDASHPDLLVDFERCILCELCVRASRDVDGKDVFAIAGRGIAAHLVVNSQGGRLADTAMTAGDRAASVCPVGAILPKRRGFAVPIGARRFDAAPVPVAPVADVDGAGPGNAARPASNVPAHPEAT